MPPRRNRRRRKAIGVGEDSEPTNITAPPPIPYETNDEATSSQLQSLIESQNLLIAGGQFSHIRGHYTNIVLNVNQATSEDTLTIQGSRSSPSGPVNVPSNETDHISPGPTSSQSTQLNHEGASPRTEVNQTILTPNSIDIYKRHLMSKGRGFPLWVPGPNQHLHLDYRRTGIRIGDVGIITHSGEFSFLFNICLPHDHPVNPPTLPEHFAPISPPIEATDIENFVMYNNGDHIASASIERSSQSTAISGTGSVFQSSASEGAILIMPRGARHEIMRNDAKFRKYASDNVADWYKFVNGPRGREAKNGDVRLVYGFDKTSSWGIATFVNETQQNSCRLKFGPPDGDSTSTYTWSENSGVTDVSLRSGPRSDESDKLRIDSDPSDFQFENQCLFVLTMNIDLKDDVWADIHSTLGSVHVDPRHVRDHSSSTGNRPQSSSPPTGGGSNLSPSPGAQYGTQRATGSIYGSGNVDLVSDNNPGMFISGLPDKLMTHPSKILNDMLLAKVPTAKMAITHDNDWTSVITQYDNASADPYYDLRDVAANVLASRKICEENGVVFLQPNVIPDESHLTSYTLPAVEMAPFGLRNVIIHGGTFNSTQDEFNISNRDPDFGLHTLRLGVSPGATYDSVERYPVPNCHPDTRRAVRQIILDWICSESSASFFFWLYGPAGAGKTAILQAIAEFLGSSSESSQIFGASFFFSRGKKGRDEGHFLFSTVAYQLALKVPGLRQHVNRIMELDPTLHTKSMDVQLQRLIVHAFSYLSPLPKRSYLVIIDGLDECHDKATQQSILQLLCETITVHKLPLRFLIGSRPESHIRHSFDQKSLCTVTRRVALDETFNPGRELRVFLQDGFAKIRAENSILSHEEQPWPGEGIIDLLVQRSSGQFIYAATVLKFVSSDFCNPTKQLGLVLNIDAMAFSDLDQLYTQILSVYPSAVDIVQILGIISVSRGEFAEVMEDIFGLEEGELKIGLRDLSSLMKYEPEKDENEESLISGATSYVIPHFAHASFDDYLFDSSRSGPFHVNRQEYENQVTIRSFLLIIQLIRMSSTTRPLHTTTWDYFTSHLPDLFFCSPKAVKEVIMMDVNILVQEFWTSNEGGIEVEASFFAMHRLLEIFQKCFDRLENPISWQSFADPHDDQFRAEFNILLDGYRKMIDHLSSKSKDLGDMLVL